MATAAQQLRQQQQQRAVSGYALINNAAMDPQMLSVQPWSATGELAPAHAVSDRAGSFTGQPATFGSPGANAVASTAASLGSREKPAAGKEGASVESTGLAASSGAAPLPEEAVAVLADDVLGLLRPAEVAHLVNLLQSGLQKRSLSAVAGVSEEPVGSSCGDGPVMAARSD
eukprot:gene3986-4238_t